MSDATPAQVAFLGATLAHPDLRDAFVQGLRQALGDTLPPIGVSAAKLGKREADAVLEFVLAFDAPIIGPTTDDDDAKCAAYAVAGDYIFLAARSDVAVNGGIREGADEVLAFLEDSSEAARFPRHSLVRTYNVLDDWRDYGEFNEGYGAHVTWPFPPRTTMLAGLVAGARVQIEGIGYRYPDEVTILQVPPKEGPQ